jgi:peptidyl-tRNA hydrolase, PTH1 family
MKLVVGLGNPGSQYSGTRHNVGFEAVDALAAKLGWIGQRAEFDKLAREKFNGLAMDGLAGSEKMLLLKPTTFMNVSGSAVQSAMAFYQLSPPDLMIVLDDLALPCGKIRLRGGGSSGGHNGLRDIERVLGTDQYPRLRLGIDAAPENIPGRDYVLGKISPQQRSLIDPAVIRATDAIVTWIEKGIESAMSLFNADV